MFNLKRKVQFLLLSTGKYLNKIMKIINITFEKEITVKTDGGEIIFYKFGSDFISTDNIPDGFYKSNLNYIELKKSLSKFSQEEIIEKFKGREL